MNKSGPRIEVCVPLIVCFSMKEFIFPLCFLSVVLYGLEPCLKATFPCLTVLGKEIAGMGFRNLSISLKGEEGFFKSSSCKGGK